MKILRRDKNKITLVKKYRKMGISFRNIAKMLESEVKTVWRWSKYK